MKKTLLLALSLGLLLTACKKNDPDPVQDNELIYANGFGVRNLDTGEPMTATSVMSMASISKAFTATAIMQLVEAGKVEPDRAESGEPDTLFGAQLRGSLLS